MEKNDVDVEDSKKPCVEKILCCNVLSSRNQSESRFFRQPFFSYEESISWPPKGWEELSCWYCGYPWPTVEGKLPQGWMPSTIPINYEPSTETWTVHGFYCSWNCAKRELISTQGFGCGERAQLIELLARKLGFEGEGEIIPAQHKQVLEKYCGKKDGISIETYRQQNINSYFTDCKPPFITQPRCYERHMISEESNGWTAQGLRLDTERTTKSLEASSSNMYARFMSSKRTEQMSTTTSQTSEKHNTVYAGTLLDYQSKK